MGRWFFWYIYVDRAWKTYGPEYLTDQAAWNLELRTKSGHLGAYMFRFVWPGAGHPTWVADTRTEPALLAGRPIQLPSGQTVAGPEQLNPWQQVEEAAKQGSTSFATKVGAHPPAEPFTGLWPHADYPEVVSMRGRTFRRAGGWKWNRAGVVAQYREDKPSESMHLFVLEDGTFRGDHIDEVNPNFGNALGHLWNDVVKGIV